MENFLRRLMDRKDRPKIDLFISGTGWMHGVTIKNVNNMFVEFTPQHEPTALWQLSCVIGAREHVSENPKSAIGVGEPPNFSPTPVQP